MLGGWHDQQRDTSDERLFINILYKCSFGLNLKSQMKVLNTWKCKCSFVKENKYTIQLKSLRWWKASGSFHSKTVHLKGQVSLFSSLMLEWTFLFSLSNTQTHAETLCNKCQNPQTHHQVNNLEGLKLPQTQTWMASFFQWIIKASPVTWRLDPLTESLLRICSGAENMDGLEQCTYRRRAGAVRLASLSAHQPAGLLHATCGGQESERRVNTEPWDEHLNATLLQSLGRGRPGILF